MIKNPTHKYYYIVHSEQLAGVRFDSSNDLKLIERDVNRHLKEWSEIAGPDDVEPYVSIIEVAQDVSFKTTRRLELDIMGGEIQYE